MKQQNNKSGYAQGNEPPSGCQYKKNTTNPNVRIHYWDFNMDRWMLIMNSACKGSKFKFIPTGGNLIKRS